MANSSAQCRAALLYWVPTSRKMTRSSENPCGRCARSYWLADLFPIFFLSRGQQWRTSSIHHVAHETMSHEVVVAATALMPLSTDVLIKCSSASPFRATQHRHHAAYGVLEASSCSEPSSAGSDGDWRVPTGFPHECMRPMKYCSQSKNGDGSGGSSPMQRISHARGGSGRRQERSCGRIGGTCIYVLHLCAWQSVSLENPWKIISVSLRRRQLATWRTWQNHASRIRRQQLRFSSG